MNILLLPPQNFVQDCAVIDNVAQLTHIRTVLKSVQGDWLKIGQLGGRLGVGQIDSIADDKIVLKNVGLTALPPKKLGVTVILALPRPKVVRRLVLDMTAMGVDKIVLLNSYNSEKSYWQSPLVSDENLQHYVWEGLQQGVDTIAPTIVKALRFKPFVEDDLPTLEGQKWVAHPYAHQSFGQLAQFGLPSVLIVGAEGGFISYEIDLLKANGVQAVSVGERILRTESAVNVLLGRWLG